MVGNYDNCISQWSEIFSNANTKIPTNSSSGNEALDKGISWVCEGTHTILDFGCGHGTMLFLSAFYGTNKHIGIDLSEIAIQKAKERAAQMLRGEYFFMHGSLELLKKMDSDSVDAVILSNIIDNLYPIDAETLLKEIHRILREKGKVLVKMNPYLTQEQIIEWGIEVIKDDLLDDGMLLLNRTNEIWTQIFNQKFNVTNYTEIVFPEYEQTNRMFCLTKR